MWFESLAKLVRWLRLRLLRPKREQQLVVGAEEAAPGERGSKESRGEGECGVQGKIAARLWTELRERQRAGVLGMSGLL